MVTCLINDSTELILCCQWEQPCFVLHDASSGENTSRARSVLCLLTPRAGVWWLVLPWLRAGLGSACFPEVRSAAPAERFLAGLFSPGVRKLEKIQKRGGMDQAGIWTMSLCCHRLGAGTQPHTESIARGQYGWKRAAESPRLCWRLCRASQNEMLGTGPSELLPVSWRQTPTKGPLPGTACQHFIS